MLKLGIKNYEIIQKTAIVIDGLTAFVGESNNGKTAGYNAIKTLAYNIQGRGYIRKEKGKTIKGGCLVCLYIPFKSQEAMISFRKDAAASYQMKIGDEQISYDKVGRGTPKEIEELLNLSPLDVDGTNYNLNFIDQLDPPMLRTFSEYSLYKTAVKSYDGDKIKQAIGLAYVEMEETGAKSQTKQMAIKLQKDERLRSQKTLVIYEPLSEIETQFIMFKEDIQTLPQMQDRLEQLKDVSSEIFILTSDLSKMQLIDKISISLEGFQKEITRATTAEKFLYTFEKLAQDENKLLNKTEALRPLEIYTSKVLDIQNDLIQTNSAEKFLNLLNNIAQDESKMLGKLSKISDIQELGKTMVEILDLLPSLNHFERKAQEIQLAESQLIDLNLFEPLNSALSDENVTQYLEDERKLEMTLKLNDRRNDLSVQLCHITEKTNSIDLGILTQLISDLSTTKEELSILTILQADREEYLNKQLRKVAEIDEVTVTINELEEILAEGKCSHCGSKVEEEKNMELNKELVDRINNLKEKKTKFETEKSMLEKQKTQYEAEAKLQGFDPETLPQTIEKTKERITQFEAAALPVVAKMEEDLNTAENSEFSGDPDSANFN